MNERIRYTELKHKENHVISIREFISKKTGARYKVILDLENLLYMIRNERTKTFIKKGGDNINNLNVLKRTARKELASLGVEMGFLGENIAVVENGRVVEFLDGEMQIGERIPGGYVFVDGSRVGDIGPSVVRERTALARDGVVVVSLALDSSGRLLDDPEILTRGFVYKHEADELMDELADQVIKAGQQRGGGSQLIDQILKAKEGYERQITKEVADEQRGWYVVDLEGQVLGRAATKIASVLRGKHKPNFTPNVDMGDFVIVVNAAKVRLTGQKMRNKMYRRHTHYPGGLREASAEHLLAKHPDRVVRQAVWGMLPKGRLGRRIVKKLRIYAGPEHNHAAQRPRELAL